MEGQLFKTPSVFWNRCLDCKGSFHTTNFYWSCCRCCLHVLHHLILQRKEVDVNNSWSDSNWNHAHKALMQAVIEWAWSECSNIKEYVRILNWLFLVEFNCHNLENYLVTQCHWSLAKHQKGMSWILFASCPDAKSLSNKCLCIFCLVWVFEN